ncbi:MAG: peptidoglycan recognition protein family protein [Vicinamibacteraceae bacterium]
MPNPSVSVHAAAVQALFVQVSDMAQAVPFDQIAKPLAAALGLSLVVERVVELLKNLLDIPLWNAAAARMGRRATQKALAPIDELLERHSNEEEFEKLEARLQAHGGASAVRRRIDEIEAEIERVGPAATRSSLDAELKELRAILDIGVEGMEWDERVPPWTVLTRPASDPGRGETVRAFVLQLIAFATGIIAAHVCNLRLFGHLLAGTPDAIQPAWDALLSGLFIGGGSAPVHVLMRFVSQRRIDVPAEVERPAAMASAPVATAEPARTRIVVAAPAAVIAERVDPEDSLPSNGGLHQPATAPVVAEWVDLRYGGGVDAALLESVHRRPRIPDTIVYHHTAMHSRSSFQDVVDVIKSRETNGRRWLTGYNCVVLADGSVHPFCRWDRYGNHAAGWNARSLGIAFNGNFEGSATDRWGNPDGRFGELRPTEAQLRAGARVIALWCHLYGIDPSFYDDGVDADFEGGIIPHKAVAQKSCPGSNFRYAELRKLVEYYVDGWARSAEAQTRIHEFKLKPYVLA